MTRPVQLTLMAAQSRESFSNDTTFGDFQF